MNIREVLDRYPELRRDLFIRGFLVTDRADISMQEFPFFGTWHSRIFAGIRFYWHSEAGAHFYESDDAALFLFGHAYNPFTMQSDEQAILQRLARHWRTDFHDCLDQLTGIFLLGVISDGQVTFVTDPTGLQSACRGIVDGHFYLSSHAQLVGDVCNLEMDAFVKDLTAYKWYGRVKGPYLPADLTPFAQIKRVVPNQIYTYSAGQITHKRFYPRGDITPCRDSEEYQRVIRQGADILRRNMQLVLEKWERPRISLTGGIDSNTAFSAAFGMYDRLETFSYLASDKEISDCHAAKRISERFGVPWTLYRVPDDNAAIPWFAEKKAVLMHNNGYVAKTPDHELRKRMVLKEQFVGDVEIKSWVSEVIRGYWHRHFGRSRMPGLSAKLYRNLYKVFLLKRGLANRLDKIYGEYLEQYEYQTISASYDAADINYWEICLGSWGSLNISEMKYYADITTIYNNRRFLDLMLGVPLERRISDVHHLDMKKILNKELWDMGICVVNANETKGRARLLNAVFTVNSHLPF